MNTVPNIAIVNPNTLAALGLTNILQGVMPMMKIDVFGSFAELEANEPDSYFHYFVDISIVLSHHDFFLSQRKKTIVLSQSADDFVLSGHFHNICTTLPEKQLMRSLLMLEAQGHPNRMNLPTINQPKEQSLTAREIEVATLVVKGNQNKEIAEKLKIGLSTVITHRKNIMAKLSIKSISSLTAYCVTHGYVDINNL